MPKNAAEVVRRHIHTLASVPINLSATDRDLLLRFGEHQDEAAFAALFQRHGAMVLGTARRIVDSTEDAEDVCQATFLLLAKKATSQRWQPSVANWLYQTTHFLALKARTGAYRRARRDRRAVSSPSPNPLAEITGQELLAVLDEELLALPGSLRAPLVVCYLEGATRDEAAQRLGCSLAALKKRLERGRQRLHAALTRRGLGLGAGLIGTLAIRHATGAAQAKMLDADVVRAALSLTAGGSVHAVVPPQVQNLLQGGIGTMSSKTFKTAIALLVGGLISTAVALAFTAGDGPKDDPSPKKPAEKAVPVPVPARNVALRYRFRVGDTYRYLVEKRMEAQTDAPGFGRHNAVTQIYDVIWRVGSVDSVGRAHMTLTIDRVRHTETDTNVPGSLIEFDSKKQRSPTGSPASVRLMSPARMAQVEAEFTCTMSQRGEITDFKAPKKVVDTLKNTHESTEVLKHHLASQGSVVLPAPPIEKGAGWSEQSEVPIAGGHAKIKFETKASYLGEKNRDERNLAEISLPPSYATIVPLPTTRIGPFTLKNHDGKGTILFDNDRGRLVAADFSQTIDVDSGPLGQTLAWKVKLSTSTKLAPAK